MNQSSWIRARRDDPCPICGKPDWCLIADDESAAICARVESEKPAGQAGWVHQLDEREAFLPAWTPPPPQRPKRKPAIDWTALSKDYVNAMTAEHWVELSATLGITVPTLQKMQWGWCRRQDCWTVPMRDNAGNIIGIRTRNLDGSKRAITGSSAGLFFAPVALKSDCIIITEGPTDTAALIDVGFHGVVGRPSCNGGGHFILDMISKQNPAAVLLVPDRDQPGIDGAARLAEMIANSSLLSVNQIGARLPPDDVKDCRDWKNKNPDHLSKIIGAEIRKLTQNFTEGKQ